MKNFFKGKKFKFSLPTAATLLMIVGLFVIVLSWCITKPITAKEAFYTPNFNSHTIKKELTHTIKKSEKDDIKTAISDIVKTEVLTTDNTDKKQTKKINSFIANLKKIKDDKIKVINDLLKANGLLTEKIFLLTSTEYKNFNENESIEQKKTTINSIIEILKSVTDFDKAWKTYIHTLILKPIKDKFNDSKGETIKPIANKIYFSKLKDYLNKVDNKGKTINIVESIEQNPTTLTITYKNEVTSDLLKSLKAFFKNVVTEEKDISIKSTDKDKKTVELKDIYFVHNFDVIKNYYDSVSDNTFTETEPVINKNKEKNNWIYTLKLKTDKTNLDNKKFWLINSKYQWFNYTFTKKVEVEVKKAGIMDLVLLPFKGFKEKIEVIVFILMLGGFLWIVIKSKVFEASLGNFIKKMKGKEIWIIPVLVSLFSLGGTVYGMGEETIAFYPILIPIMLMAGFDVMTTVLTILLGAGVGCLASIINPFVIVPDTFGKNGLVGKDAMSGVGVRALAWVLFTAITAAFCTWYGWKVKNNPACSVVADKADYYKKEFALSGEKVEFTKQRKAIFGVLITTFILMIFLMITWQSFGKAGKALANSEPVKTPLKGTRGGFGIIIWAAFGYDIGWTYMYEVSALFLVSAIICGLILRKSEKNIVGEMTTGAADILSVCVVLAIAGGIAWLLVGEKTIHNADHWLYENTEKTDGKVILTTNLAKYIVTAFGKSGINEIGVFGFTLISYIFYIPMSVLITSSSGFNGAVIKPVMGPLASTISKSHSLNLTAFSFANGLVNMFSPTSFILMAGLGASKVSINKLWKASWPYYIVIFVMSILLLVCGAAALKGNPMSAFA